jgi:hypothetical protein
MQLAVALAGAALMLAGMSAIVFIGPGASKWSFPLSLAGSAIVMIAVLILPSGRARESDYRTPQQRRAEAWKQVRQVAAFLAVFFVLIWPMGGNLERFLNGAGRITLAVLAAVAVAGKMGGSPWPWTLRRP